MVYVEKVHCSVPCAGAVEGGAAAAADLGVGDVIQTEAVVTSRDRSRPPAMHLERRIAKSSTLA